MSLPPRCLHFILRVEIDSWQFSDLLMHAIGVCFRDASQSTVNICDICDFRNQRRSALARSENFNAVHSVCPDHLRYHYIPV